MIEADGNSRCYQVVFCSERSVRSFINFVMQSDNRRVALSNYLMTVMLSSNLKMCSGRSLRSQCVGIRKKLNYHPSVVCQEPLCLLKVQHVKIVNESNSHAKQQPE